MNWIFVTSQKENRNILKLQCIHSSFVGHVCVAHLFAGLIHEMDTTSVVERLNIATSLFVVSVRFYLHVFNRWWIEGQLRDWCNEFVIEKW